MIHNATCMEVYYYPGRQMKLETLSRLLEEISEHTDGPSTAHSIKNQICPRIAKIADLMSEINDTIKLVFILLHRSIESKLELKYSMEFDDARSVFRSETGKKPQLFIIYNKISDNIPRIWMCIQVNGYNKNTIYPFNAAC